MTFLRKASMSTFLAAGHVLAVDLKRAALWMVDMTDAVQVRQLQRFEIEEIVADAAVADLHVEGDCRRGRRLQDLLR